MEGVAILKDPTSKILKVGKKVSTQNIKQQVHEDSKSAKEACDKAKDALKVNANTEDRVFDLVWGPT